MKIKTQPRIFVSLLLTLCLLALPVTALAKKGDKSFRKGLEYESSQQWEKAAQEFTLALAADPSNMEYQLHFRRASFNASQAYMQQGRALAEKQDYIGAYNAFRQAYGYDPVNSLAVSEMERMLRLQSVKEGNVPSNIGTPKGADLPEGGTLSPSAAQVPDSAFTTSQQMRVITYSGDLKAFIRSLAEQLNLNVIFDRQSFAQPRTIDLNLREVTTAQALDYVFLQESLFFQKLSRRTILVADQTRRPQYQQLVLRTFFLSNIDPTEARQLVTQAIPPSVGRPQTIVVPDKATNSLTVRDTAENVRLIGELLQSIDKDRAEVVMDVSIYEVSKNDLLQFGNQWGSGAGAFSLGGSPGLAVLSSSGVTNAAQAGVNLASIIGASPTGAAAALIIPSMAWSAFQSKDNTKLIASTQVHAFNGEESTARIGQRVPVQTAQTYPFGVQTGQPSTPNGFPTGGFPVINYEPTGLTLKFTPQVFPNLDVQVKMSIESKDVLGASTLTPTFTERTITGTARVQNNRTMMLASVSTDIQTNGRRGLPVLGSLPILGRLFTAPTRDNRNIDIVIAVTPRVLRAPAVTPRDEEMRPSGTLQSPTTGSLEAMIRDSDREDQLAAGRRLPRNAEVVVNADPGTFKSPTTASRPAQNAATESAATNAANSGTTAATTGATVATANPPVNPPAAETAKPQVSTEELSSFVPAPKSLVSDRAAAEVAAVNPSNAGNAVLTSLPKPIDASATVRRSRTALLSLTPADQEMKVGEKRQIAIELNSDIPLGLAVMTLRFDPKMIKVNSVIAGSLFALGAENNPSITQSIDPSGVCLISISTLNKSLPMVGAGPLVFIEIEAIAAGDAGLVFDRETMHLVATDARDVVLELKQGRATVKQ